MVIEMTLDFFQIYYHESQKDQLYPFAKPYFSAGLTPYFENSIIAGLVPSSSADLISICSWRLRQKRGNHIHYLGGVGTDSLTEEKIFSQDYDVAILTPHSTSHRPLAIASNWHGKAWVDAFNAFRPFLKQNLGRVPDELNYAIYENHFIAKGEIYRSYVTSCLIPAIEFIGEQEVFRADSSYLSKKKDEEEIKRVQTLLKVKDWPILPFILERLFGLYINDKGLKVINL